PGPATTRTGPGGASMASSCFGEGTSTRKIYSSRSTVTRSGKHRRPECLEGGKPRLQVFGGLTAVGAGAGVAAGCAAGTDHPGERGWERAGLEAGGGEALHHPAGNEAGEGGVMHPVGHGVAGFADDDEVGRGIELPVDADE